jgi:hypothetical protein
MDKDSNVAAGEKRKKGKGIKKSTKKHVVVTETVSKYKLQGEISNLLIVFLSF